MAHEEALAELRRGSGGQFDPDVVQAFDDLMDEGDEDLPMAA